ncbi:putative E3 ubiquitin-protein ligase [Xylographa trunciseda]|nr:putative E3 ubiquitin-protein ligase [Xylographa trunciseda]
MPSWSSRLLSTGSASNNNASHRATPQGHDGPLKPSSSETAPLETPLRSVTFLASEGSPTRTSPTSLSPRHGRSISHPFPTLFGASKRKNSKADIQTNGGDIDTGDEEVEYGKPSPRTPSQTAVAHDMDQLLVTGRCATCDALVRWPRHLEVYRCTVCLMINDLKPAVRDAAEVSNSNATPIADTIRRTRIPRKVLPLSLERTKRLIDQCTISVIKSVVNRAAEEPEVNNTSCLGGRPRSVSAPSQQIHRDKYYPLKSSKGISAQKYQNVRFEAYSTHDLTYNLHDSPITEGSIAHQTFDTNSTPTSHTGPPPSRAPPPPPIQRKSLPRSANAGMTKNAPKKSLAKYVYQPLETYLTACLSDCEALNDSFDIGRPQPVRAASEASLLSEKSKRRDVFQSSDAPLPGLDGKTLLLGNFAENGMWWTGSRRQYRKQDTKEASNAGKSGEKKTPRIDWSAVVQWYSAIFTCGEAWRTLLQSLITEHNISSVSLSEEEEISDLLAQGRQHLQRNFLKNIENLLRRPGRPVKTPEDCRFLLILLANPLLYPCHRPSQDDLAPGDTAFEIMNQLKNKSMESTLQIQRNVSSKDSYAPRGGATGQHSGIIKRIIGLMANSPSECHQVLVSWFRRFSDSQFRETVELVGGFVSYRLSRQSGRKKSDNRDSRPELVPTMSGLGAGTSAHLHAALGASRTPKAPDAKDSMVVYNEDWQIKAAAKVMSLLFSANNSGRSTAFDHNKKNAETRKHQGNTTTSEYFSKTAQILPTNTFYNTLLDYADLIADFECWESRRGKFSFCQYPMFLSVWAKIHIMEYDTRRQMEVKAREAFFNSILSRKAINQYLLLKVRRDCLVDDSLKRIGEVVGTGQEEIKKGLRIQFVGEEGIDAGGLRKEWFLLLVREVFDPEYGLFLYDEESRYCYFNPNSFETSDQFFLVGVVLGLAIYNSTILDVALPPFAFRKLLAAAPTYNGPVTSLTRVPVSYTLNDLAEWRPSLARGLKQLLEYEGNVQETFCRDFVIDVARYGHIGQVPLCINGEKRAVTNSNRQEFVDLYVRYLLDVAVVRQFEPFKRGFFTVCGGNALSLFRPEEIELLIRGSDEPLDVTSLRAVASYEGWGPWAAGENGEEDPIVNWFWDAFAGVELKWQRKILSFITGSDRIPAMGATSLTIKLSCLGDNYERFPIARTCFNQLGLYRYRTRTELEAKLWRAICESEGFGLK